MVGEGGSPPHCENTTHLAFCQMDKMDILIWSLLAVAFALSITAIIMSIKNMKK